MRFLLVLIMAVCFASCSGSKNNGIVENTAVEAAKVLKYGVEIDKYDVEPGMVKKGDYFGSIMEDCGVGASVVPQILKASKNVFDLTKIKL